MEGLVAEEAQNGPRKMKKKTQILRDIIRPLTPEFEVESEKVQFSRKCLNFLDFFDRRRTWEKTQNVIVIYATKSE